MKKGDWDEIYSDFMMLQKIWGVSETDSETLLADRIPMGFTDRILFLVGKALGAFSMFFHTTG